MRPRICCLCLRKSEKKNEFRSWWQEFRRKETQNPFNYSTFDDNIRKLIKQKNAQSMKCRRESGQAVATWCYIILLTMDGVQHLVRRVIGCRICASLAKFLWWKIDDGHEAFFLSIIHWSNLLQTETQVWFVLFFLRHANMKLWFLCNELNYISELFWSRWFKYMQIFFNLRFNWFHMQTFTLRSVRFFFLFFFQAEASRETYLPSELNWRKSTLFPLRISIHKT